MTAVVGRGFARRLAPRASLAQRLSDALRFRRGSVPGARGYGSVLRDALDRNVDADFPSLVFKAVAEAIRHPYNGLQDLTLRTVEIEGEGQQATVMVHAYHEGGNVVVPVVV